MQKLRSKFSLINGPNISYEQAMLASRWYEKEKKVILTTFAHPQKNERETTNKT